MSKGTITAHDIQALEIFKTFNRTDRLMALKAFNIKVINQGLIVYRTSNTVDPRVIGRNHRVLLELIEKEKET